MTFNKKFIGSSFDDFLPEEALLEGTTATAVKRVIACQIGEDLKERATSLKRRWPRR